jgi:hypothetical protein
VIPKVAEKTYLKGVLAVYTPLKTVAKIELN